MIDKQWPVRRIADIENMVRELAPAFSEHEPEVIGAVLGELVACFIAGHSRAMQSEARRLFIEYIDDLIPLVLEDIEGTASGQQWRQ